jgi:hypothetical protein
VPKKRKLHKNELNTRFFCSTTPSKGSKWLKIFKFSLTFRFDKLSNLSKSAHTGENSQILTVSNKKIIFAPNNLYLPFFLQTFITNYLRNVKKPGIILTSKTESTMTLIRV